MRLALEARRTRVLAVAALTLLAFGLRLAAFRQGLFGDELLTYGETRGGLDEVFEGLKRSGAEVTPPLYFILAWASVKLGDAPELIRLPSLILGTALVPVVYSLGRRVAGVPAGLMAAAIAATGPFALFYGSEARAYTAAMFFVALSTLALLEALSGGRRAWWGVYVVSACAACYTHYTTIFVLGAQAAWALWVHREQLGALLVAQVAIAIGYLPWVPSLIDQRDKGLNIAVVGSSGPVTVSSFAESVFRTLVGHPYQRLSELPGQPALVLIAVGAALAAGAAALELRRRGRAPRPGSALVLMAILALATPVGLAVYGIFGDDLFAPRNLSASIPALAVLVGALATMVPGRAAAAAAALMLAGLALGTVEFFDPDRVRPAYREVARYLDERAAPRDPIVASDRDSLNAYFERPHEVYRPGLEDAPAWEQALAGGQVYFVGSRVLARYAFGRPVAGPGNLFIRRQRKGYRGLVPLIVDRYQGMVTGRLERSGEGESISWTFGRDVQVGPGAARGVVEDAAIVDDQLAITGWATVTPEPDEVDWVLAFAGPRLVSVGWTPYPRPDVAEAFGPAALNSGYRLSSPATREPDGLRVFALVGRRATELKPP
jgi:hypothetical protein